MNKSFNISASKEYCNILKSQMADRSVAQFSTNKSVVESNKDSNKIQNNSEEKSQQGWYK